MPINPAKKESIMKRLNAILLICVVWSAVPTVVQGGARGDIHQGNELYRSGSYARSIEKYNAALQKQPESDIINFNLGSALYKTGSYKEAADHFQKALLSEEDALKQKAHYNLGNAIFRQGEILSSKNPQSALPVLEQSLRQYEQALNIDQTDDDAKYNHEFVKKFLEALRQQVKNQEQQKRAQQDRQKHDQGEEPQQNSGSPQRDQPQAQGDQQAQANQAEKQDQPEKRDDPAQGVSEGAQQNGQEENALGQGSNERTERSAIKAQMSLDEYERSQEGKRFLNLNEPFSDRPVLKDW